MKLWSLDVRSWGPILATLCREKRASLEGILISVLPERAVAEGPRPGYWHVSACQWVGG